MKLHCGDCLKVLAAMPAAAFDAVVTDPPYGLGFMGKTWDKIARRRIEAARKAMLRQGRLPIHD